jgi:hypothetical protein
LISKMGHFPFKVRSPAANNIFDGENISELNTTRSAWQPRHSYSALSGDITASLVDSAFKMLSACGTTKTTLLMYPSQWRTQTAFRIDKEL